MSKKKWDWDRLHMQYLVGAEPNVAQFLREKSVNPRAGWVLKRTSGWAAERQQIGSRAAGEARKQLEHDLTQTDVEVRRDTLRLYRTIPGLLSRALRLRALTPKQREFEEAQVDAVLEKTKAGMPLTEQDKRWAELPASIDPFAFESMLRGVRLILGMPTHIEKGEHVHRVASITDLVDELGSELDEAAEAQMVRGRASKGR